MNILPSGVSVESVTKNCTIQSKERKKIKYREELAAEG